ncbi:hypothetical protein D3C85_1326900 [compost metagenome]
MNKREAYIASGALNLLEPALSVTHADGNKSTVLAFSDVKTEQLDQNRKLTSVILKDPKYNFSVTLKYLAYYNENVIEQWAEITHREKGWEPVPTCSIRHHLCFPSISRLPKIWGR